jgi:glycosyltransferase involved in cell wall biosynthesis
MNKLKICFLGDFENRLDEGMTNVSFHLYEEIKKEYPNTVYLSLKQIFSPKFWKQIRKFNPDLVHLVSGPTVRLLILLKIIQITCKSKTVVSSTKSSLKGSFKKISKFLKPNLVIVNSKKSEDFFKSINFKTKFFPNGVDTRKFIPVTKEQKNQLRKKFNIQQNEFVVLHVGPLIKGRNQRALLELENIRLLLVLSLTNKSDEIEIKKLTKNNVTIYTEYFPNIEEIYQLSDAYIFPIFDGFHSIETPLSVLEALSCNLPVISSRYGGGLESFLEEGDGLIFVDNIENTKRSLSKIKTENNFQTRKKIEKFTWSEIAKKIIFEYNEL